MGVREWLLMGHTVFCQLYAASEINVLLYGVIIRPFHAQALCSVFERRFISVTRLVVVGANLALS